MSEMLEAIGQPDLDIAAKDLVEMAAKRGGEKGDNISLALARIEGKEEMASILLDTLKKLFR